MTGASAQEIAGKSSRRNKKKKRLNVDTRIVMKSLRKINKTSRGRKSTGRRQIEDHRWYHGLRTQDDIAPLLRETGDFLVRAVQSIHSCTLVLDVKSDDEICNFTIYSNGSEYSLQSLSKESDSAEKFSTVPHLLKYYKRHRLPNGTRLIRAIRRPHWLLRHNAVKYNKSDKLGSGNFCDVFKGKAVIENGEVEVAIKVCHPPSNDVSAANVIEARTSMINEAKIMAGYKSNYLIKFYGVACDSPPIMILMELCAGGSLDAHLRKRGTNISATEKLLYLFEASKGMRYLHSVNCVHRDLAARNCLISSDGIVKVSDFGLSVILENGKTMCKSVIKEAPIRWFAPECCYMEPSFSKKTDVWAFGTLMYEVFSNGSKPFVNVSDLDIIRAIRKANMPPPPDETPTTVVTLFKQIWELQPTDRPSFDDICKSLKEAIQISPPLSIVDLVVNQLPGVKRTQELLPKSEVAESIRGSKSKLDLDTSSLRTRSDSVRSRRRAFDAMRAMRKTSPTKKKGVSEVSKVSKITHLDDTKD